MARPQPTPFVRFSKELFEAFYQNAPDTVAACRLWLWVMRYTYGNFGKEETPVKSLGEIADEVSMSKPTVCRELAALVRCRRLKMGEKGGYSIQKDYDLWREDTKKRQQHFGNKPQQIALIPGYEQPVDNLWITVSNGEMDHFTVRNKSLHRSKFSVSPYETPIRSKNTVENGEGAAPQHLPNGKNDTPTNRAELGHPDHAPQDHEEFRRLSFKIQDRLSERWEARVEEELKKSACRKACGRPRASEYWTFCRPCTVCSECGGRADGARKFSVVKNVIVCNDCKEK